MWDLTVGSKEMEMHHSKGMGPKTTCKVRIWTPTQNSGPLPLLWAFPLYWLPEDVGTLTVIEISIAMICINFKAWKQRTACIPLLKSRESEFFNVLHQVRSSYLKKWCCVPLKTILFHKESILHFIDIITICDITCTKMQDKHLNYLHKLKKRWNLCNVSLNVAFFFPNVTRSHIYNSSVLNWLWILSWNLATAKFLNFTVILYSVTFPLIIFFPYNSYTD